MRHICTIMQSYISRHPNLLSSYRYDREKHYTILTHIMKQNVIYDIINVVQHELLGFDIGRLLPDVILKRANSLAVVDGVLSRFFLAIAATRTIWHVCKVCYVIQSEKGQCVPSKLPGELELGVVQEALIWLPVPLRANSPSLLFDCPWGRCRRFSFFGWFLTGRNWAVGRSLPVCWLGCG